MLQNEPPHATLAFVDDVVEGIEIAFEITVLEQCLGCQVEHLARLAQHRRHVSEGLLDENRTLLLAKPALEHDLLL